jgi:toxin ParE1/3/4
MAYAVKVSVRAERDLANLYREINAEHADAALKWYLRLTDAIFSLKEQPNRCPVAPENNRYRHLLYGNKPHIYRVIYRVIERHRRVEVLHIRHGARMRIAGLNLD